MKKYEKPMLMAVSVSGNDQLCGSCSDQGRTPLYNNEELKNNLLLYADKNGDGELSRDEASMLFGLEDNCKRPLDGYCKFTSTGSVTLVAWS